MPPVLCMIHNTEFIFAKKLTPQEKELEPRRFRRAVRKFIKKIKPGERIMFVGISSRPHRALMKQVSQFYEHIILFPRPNYGSRRSKNHPINKHVFFFSFIEIFHEILIEKCNMSISDIELSILASISKGYTAGQILETINEIVKIKYEDKYSSNTCTANDFIPLLGIKTPVFINEENRIKVGSKTYFLFYFHFIK